MMVRLALLSLLGASVAFAQAADVNIEKLHAPPKTPGVPVEFHGFIRSTYMFTDPALQDEVIGSRNGFRLQNARLGFRIIPTEKVAMEISIDGASGLRNVVDPLEGRRGVDLRDAFVGLRLHPLAHVRIGQFKAPFNVETLLSDGDLPFVTRSVITDGVNPPDAFTRTGLTLDRQLGAEIASEPLRLGDFQFAYAFAAMNGNGQNALLNDNGAVMPVGRVTVGFKEWLSLGLNAYYNPVDVGVRPNRLKINQLTAGTDLVLRYNGFSAVGVLLWRQSTVQNAELPAENALGYMATLQYLHASSGFETAVRYTDFDPSSVDPFDRTSDISAMVGYRMKSVPMRWVLQYDVRMEHNTQQLNNNSIEAMAHVSW